MYGSGGFGEGTGSLDRNLGCADLEGVGASVSGFTSERF